MLLYLSFNRNNIKSKSKIMIEFKFNDGGRQLAGYKGLTDDCVVRSIAIASGLPYQEVYDHLFSLSRKRKSKAGSKSPRNGVPKSVFHKYILSLGFLWIPKMGIGTGCKVHLRRDELPSGTLIVSLSRHLTTVIDGVVNDTFDPSRGGTRCVYGFYIKK